MNRAYIDFETYCDLDLRKVGAYRYAKHPSCEVLICCYLLPGMGEPATWLPREDPCPADLLLHMERHLPVCAHNASFERLIWLYALIPQVVGLPFVPDTSWICTAVKAASWGLPRGLDGALAGIGSKVTKNPCGVALMKTFSMPRKPTKKDLRNRILPERDLDRFAEYIEYCKQDVRATKLLDNALPDLTAQEKDMFILDLDMNDRGVPIDIPLVKKAVKIVGDLEEQNAIRVVEITGGIRATQVGKLKEYLKANGLAVDDMRAPTLQAALQDASEDPETEHLVELLELRSEASRVSTKKLNAMLLCADPEDDRVRGSFLFYGAHTGRYAGRLVQFQNLVRGNLTEQQCESVFDLLEYGSAQSFSVLYDDPLNTISQCLRGFVRAPFGYELAVADYSAIEARVLAWVADEISLLVTYRAGLDVYKVMAATMYKLESTEDVTDEQRRIAKSVVLGCGYQLGPTAFIQYCANMGINIEPDFATSVVSKYRRAVPAIVNSWRHVERLAIAAIQTPGESYEGLKCSFSMHEHWLCIKLPSGRSIRYPYATATPVIKYNKPAYEIGFKRVVNGQLRTDVTYGGKLIENIVQAIAFDVLMQGMRNLECEGYLVVATIHDEPVCLAPKGESSLPLIETAMCWMPEWANGLPLAAKGFVCERYRKG